MALPDQHLLEARSGFATRPTPRRLVKSAFKQANTRLGVGLSALGALLIGLWAFTELGTGLIGLLVGCIAFCVAAPLISR